MIQWKDDYSTGIDVIDNQHKKLFNIANKIYELLRDELCTDKYDKIVEILDELKDYTVYHFKSEEEYMKSINYNKLFSQKIEHDYFVSKFDEIDYDKIDVDQDKYILEILDFIVNWITNHIISKDKLIKQALTKSNINS